MKTIVVLFFLLPGFAVAQAIALLDRDFKNPITVTQNLTREQLSKRWFPVYAADLDTMIQLTEELVRAVNNRTLLPPAIQILKAGHSHLAVLAQRTGLHTAWRISVSTRCGNVGTSLDLVKLGYSHKKAVQELLSFLDYLKNNRHMVGSESERGI